MHEAFALSIMKDAVSEYEEDEEEEIHENEKIEIYKSQ